MRATATKHQQLHVASEAPPNLLNPMPLWQLEITELAGHNIEARGREEVNRLLQAGWLLLHIYTLKYEEDGVWRERPMAILGRPGSLKQRGEGEGVSIEPDSSVSAVQTAPSKKESNF